MTNGKWQGDDITVNGGAYCTKLPPVADLGAGFQFAH